MLPVSAWNTIIHNKVVSKPVVEKFNFSKLKIEKVKFFTRVQPNFFCGSVFNVGGCLIFRPIFKLDL